MSDFKIPENPRFRSWCILFIVICVCAISHGSRDMDCNVCRGVFVTICVSLVLALIGVFLFIRNITMFQGKFEAITAGVVSIFWIVILPFIMDPKNNIAIGIYSSDIINANLYFFSWAAIGYSIFIFSQAMSEILNRDVTHPNPKLVKWLGLVVVSGIVLVSSSLYQKASCEDLYSKLSRCKRNLYGISVGAVGIAIPGVALTLNLMKRTIHKFELGASSLMLLSYIFQVGFATFGEGPARTVNNIFLSTWVGFAIALQLFFDCFKESFESEKKGDDTVDDLENKREKNQDNMPIGKDVEYYPSSEDDKSSYNDDDLDDKREMSKEEKPNEKKGKFFSALGDDESEC